MPANKKPAGKRAASAANKAPEASEPDHDPRWEQARTAPQ